MYVQGRLGSQWLGVAVVDLIFGILFVLAFRRTAARRIPEVPADTRLDPTAARSVSGRG
jgi:hypothetical protein